MRIQKFQNMMRQIYFQRDYQRGTIGTLNWLVEEVEELKEAIEEGEKKAIENEFADVFAWLASLANVVKIDLEEVAMSKYDNRCPKCRRNPCECSF